MPSSLMGSSQSVPKAAFEEALQNSIELSLRSPAVTPSTVFSSLLSNYSPSSSSFSESSDVKPNVEELNSELSKRNLDRAETDERKHDEIGAQPSSSNYVAPPRTTSMIMSKASGPPALISVSSVHKVQEETAADGRQYVPEPQLLAQQHQLEKFQKARFEQFKQLQRFQAWQQLQKEQSSKPRILMNAPHVTEQAVSTTALQPPSCGVDARLPASNPVTMAMNGLQSNGNSHALLPGSVMRNERPRAKSLKGFCKNGKDIRLSTVENHFTLSHPCSKEFALIAVQPNLSVAGNYIVVAMKLASLPHIQNSSQALLAQCIGCGEKSLHSLVQLVDHIGIETTVDIANSRHGATMLLSSFVRFYLLHDRHDPNKLQHGPAATWKGSGDERTHPGQQTSNLSALANNNGAVPMFRGNLTMVDVSQPPALTPTRMQESIPAISHMMSPAAYNQGATLRPHLKRTLSSPLHHNFSEAAKRQVSSYSQDEVVEIRDDDPPPKRYVLNHTESRSIEIPNSFSALGQAKPIIAFLFPVKHLPAIVGNEESIVVTLHFSNCFHEPSRNMREELKLSDYTSSCSNFMLLITVQYLSSLGFAQCPSLEGLACAVMHAKKELSRDLHPPLEDVKASGVLAISKIVAAASDGVIELIHSKTSVAEAISRCLKNVQSSSCPYHVAVFLPDEPNADISFHLVVGGRRTSRSLSESLLSNHEIMSLIGQGLVSLPFSQLRQSLSNSNAITQPSISPTLKFSLSSSAPRNRIPSQHVCSARQQTNSKIAASLLNMIEKIFREHKNADLVDFTSLRFLILLPPSSALLSQTVQCLSHSSVITELFKTSLPVSSLSSQVVVTMEASSKQSELCLQRQAAWYGDRFHGKRMLDVNDKAAVFHRMKATNMASDIGLITSMCKQWEGSSTLLVLVQFDAHSILNSSEAYDCLNQPFVLNSKNILTIQCSSSPYALLTDASFIRSDNILFSKSNDNCDQNSNTSLYFGTSSNCPISFTTSFDQLYESEKDRLLTSHCTLHSSLVASELLMQQYSSSLLMSSATDSTKSGHSTTPLVNQIIQELLRSSQSREGIIVIVRISSPLLAARFYDTIKQTRDKLDLDLAFEVVLYCDTGRPISLSTYFLEILQAQHDVDSDWFPSALSDLTGIPCLIVYEGNELSPQLMPSTLKYVDLRLAFEGTGRIYRAKIEQELSLAAPLCQPEERKKVPKQEVEDLSDDDDDDSRLQVIEDNHLDFNSNHVEDEASSEYNCPDENEIKVKKEVANDGDARADDMKSPFIAKEDPSVDFISLAMREADLPSNGKSKAVEVCGLHLAPLAILPEQIYNIVHCDSQHTSVLSILPPHQHCKWNGPLRNVIANDTSPVELAAFYRQHSTPSEENPDYTNTEHTVDEKRILLVTPPNSQPLLGCCLFLRLLHNKLMGMLEVSVYDDPEEDNGEFGKSFRSFLSNSLRRGISQITNSCHNVDMLVSYMHSGGERLHRRIVTRECKNGHTTANRRSSSSGNDTPYSQKSTAVYVLKAPNAEMYFRIVIPRRHLVDFKFSPAEDGSFELISLRLKLKTDQGLKTPVISIGVHGVEHGLYNLSTGSNFAGYSSEIIHFVIVKDCDAEAYKKAMPGHIIVVLPIEFDYLGNGALKHASQILFNQFYKAECSSTDAPELVWPYVLLINDDVVAWSKWQASEIESQPLSDQWKDVTLNSVVETVESFMGYEFAAVGFRPWSNNLKVSHLQKQNMHNQENYLSSCYLESCLFLNLKLTSSISFTRNRFDNEDIDWSLRAAASGLKLYRFENITVATKVMPPPEAHNSLLNADTTLVTAADTSFEPLYHHPALLLEKHLSYHATSMFPSSKRNPTNPVLCVDCYLSLGTEVCVQFASSASHAQLWTFDYGKKYGGLVLPCVNMNIKPEFLQGLEFVKGATVCVIGKNRSSLRQTIGNLNLETAWYFRLTDEFQTTNSQTLGCARVCPYYFLTGVKKES